jgi:hypothetical protein
MALSRSNQAAEVESVAGETTADSVLEQDTPTPTAEEQMPGQGTLPASAPATMPSTSMATAVASSKEAIVQGLAQTGMEGLELDWTSYQTVVLNQGEFETRDGEGLDTSDFTVRVIGSRSSYAFRSKHEKEADCEVCFSYDQHADRDVNSPVYEKVKQWKEEDGVGYETKKYLEILAAVEDDNCILNGQLVNLQIPPTSVGRVSGFFATNQLMKKQHPSEYLTKVSKGKKITKGQFPFTPWQFEYLG